MEAKAIAKYVRVSPQKAGLVLELIRNKKVEEAISILELSSKKSASLIKNVLNSAIANATENHGMLIEDLTIIRAVANEGPRMKRYRARAKGRVDRKIKRTSNLEIVVSDEWKGDKK